MRKGPLGGCSEFEFVGPRWHSPKGNKGGKRNDAPNAELLFGAPGALLRDVPLNEGAMSSVETTCSRKQRPGPRDPNRDRFSG